jgi:MFS transporter, DHA1 family, multidrug/chloramphenicol efflux transport protein
MSAPLINISRKQAFIFALFLVFFEFLTYITNDMIMPGMLKVIDTFHAPETAVADSLTAYLFGGASLQLIIGPISDAIGRRPVMLFGCILFIFFTVLLGCSQSMPQFLTGRFFQGMGLCFLIIGYAVVQELFAEMDAVRLIALMTNAAMAAPLLGPLLGAIFISHFQWREMYWLIALLSILSFYGLWKTMPETVGVYRRDGSILPKSKLTTRVIANNYLQLLTHGKFMVGVISLGILSTPCLAWIGISPLILMTQAKLSLINYALWQIPFFMACILGNFFLRLLTHHFKLKTIISIGSVIVCTGLISMALFPYFFKGHYLSLMPGLTLYGFGMGTTTGPLTRLLLFSTSVAKGTTNALLNVTSMLIMGLGTELANLLYQTPNNLYFGEYCAILGIVYFILMSISLKHHEQA